jgi:hypothetical protein
MYRNSVVIDKILTHLDEKDALAEPLVLPQSRAPLSALRNCIPYGRGKALICLLPRKRYSLRSRCQTVFHGAIEHHFSVFDTFRLWGKECLFLLYAL